MLLGRARPNVQRILPLRVQVCVLPAAFAAEKIKKKHGPSSAVQSQPRWLIQYSKLFKIVLCLTSTSQSRSSGFCGACPHPTHPFCVAVCKLASGVCLLWVHYFLTICYVNKVDFLMFVVPLSHTTTAQKWHLVLFSKADNAVCHHQRKFLHCQLQAVRIGSCATETGYICQMLRYAPNNGCRYICIYTCLRLKSGWLCPSIHCHRHTTKKKQKKCVISHVRVLNED